MFASFAQLGIGPVLFNFFRIPQLPLSYVLRAACLASPGEGALRGLFDFRVLDTVRVSLRTLSFALPSVPAGILRSRRK